MCFIIKYNKLSGRIEGSNFWVKGVKALIQDVFIRNRKIVLHIFSVFETYSKYLLQIIKSTQIYVLKTNF